MGRGSSPVRCSHPSNNTWAPQMQRRLPSFQLFPRFSAHAPPWATHITSAESTGCQEPNPHPPSQGCLRFDLDSGDQGVEPGRGRGSVEILHGRSLALPLKRSASCRDNSKLLEFNGKEGGQGSRAWRREYLPPGDGVGLGVGRQREATGQQAQRECQATLLCPHASCTAQSHPLASGTAPSYPLAPCTAPSRPGL